MPSITRRAGNRGQDRRDAVEEQLQLAMERLLDQGHSFTQISIEQLATSAGIARATFYLHYRDKGDLVTRLMQRVSQEIKAATGRWFESPESATREDLRAAVKGVVDTYRRHYAVMAAMVETASYDAAVDALFNNVMNGLIDANRKVIKRVKAAGRAHPDLTADTAETLTWAFERCCLQRLRAARPAQVNALIEALTHLAWSTIFLPESSPKKAAVKPRPRRA